MGRILAIDYGKVRTGLAVTDPLQIIATALETVKTDQLINYLERYIQNEEVDALVLGLPLSLRSEDTPTTTMVRSFGEVLKDKFPDLPLHFIDERFTSKMASDTLISSGVKKKDRKVKGNTDLISAVIILQSYLQSKGLPR
ncbi:Holliday junction resolvase RuvX [Leadbetterella byssophila]|uniref:Putative pre-16S rRNA nuclease n=1 Tax=Leadbetterella byssophila (strain DSM 17132 / JCM 16389 / KACC 11308 / NBRC 106382 / 4M15) TaxID=649349 RepID=E4RRB0_LEAB4|nr:Holliday junction resolvase RuvX [Leadbetterella byssophila]ADQ18443.1 Holliday junction resolvase YqgF [Leadbetterella byssophila DSM 17132]